jgi:hypothetical protein
MSEDTSLVECPACGRVEVPDRGVIESLIPGTDDLQEWEDRGPRVQVS